jgi:hypothetical protein
MASEGPRDALIGACREGPVTLFLGAGISHSRGVPLWDDVVARLTEWLQGESNDDEGTLDAVRALVRERLGDEVASCITMRRHPLEPQLALEWIQAQLACADVRARVAERLGIGDASFVALLRRALYEDVRARDAASPDALGAVGEVVRAEWDRGRERVLVRIVTLNADDLLEREVADDGVARLQPIARPSRYPELGRDGAPPPIPVYHVHGFLPEDTRDPEGSNERLVFTDDQFWSTTASPLSFANRVVANALHDTRCVFAGLSMRDVNLLRWLAVHFEEVASDARTRGEPPELLRRHFWIHTPDDDPTGVLAEVLARRGVVSVQLPSWRGTQFSELLRTCFAQ